ncbi:MAG: hypothetical protein M0C28_03610 [Candidatus Moduliflexus flocculans]|nr:hypothetical protein [Candidatus Moduliflexus flocculans]
MSENNKIVRSDPFKKIKRPAPLYILIMAVIAALPFLFVRLFVPAEKAGRTGRGGAGADARDGPFGRGRRVGDEHPGRAQPRAEDRPDRHRGHRGRLHRRTATRGSSAGSPWPATTASACSSSTAGRRATSPISSTACRRRPRSRSSSRPTSRAGRASRSSGRANTRPTWASPRPASEDLMYRAASAAAVEGRAMGVHLTYTPVCDIAWDPDNPAESVRSFGGDLDLLGRMVRAYVARLPRERHADLGQALPGPGRRREHAAEPRLGLDRQARGRASRPRSSGPSSTASTPASISS